MHCCDSTVRPMMMLHCTKRHHGPYYCTLRRVQYINEPLLGSPVHGARILSSCRFIHRWGFPFSTFRPCKFCKTTIQYVIYTSVCIYVYEKRRYCTVVGYRLFFPYWSSLLEGEPITACVSYTRIDVAGCDTVYESMLYYRVRILGTTAVTLYYQAPSLSFRKMPH